MPLSIALVKLNGQVHLEMGAWETEEEVQNFIDDVGSDEEVLSLHKFEGARRNKYVLEALGYDGDDPDSLAEDVEKLLQFVFRLGLEFKPSR